MAKEQEQQPPSGGVYGSHANTPKPAASGWKGRRGMPTTSLPKEASPSDPEPVSATPLTTVDDEDQSTTVVPPPLAPLADSPISVAPASAMPVSSTPVPVPRVPSAPPAYNPPQYQVPQYGVPQQYSAPPMSAAPQSSIPVYSGIPAVQQPITAPPMSAPPMSAPPSQFVSAPPEISPAEELRRRKAQKAALPSASTPKKKSLLSNTPFAGGRWLRFVFLTAMILAFTVIFANGVYRLVGKALYDAPSLPAGTSFPVQGAQGYAASFMTIYFSWDADKAEAREEALTAFFPSGDASGDLGDPAGVQTVQAVIPSGFQAHDDAQGFFKFDLFLNYMKPNEEGNSVATTSRVCADISVQAKENSTGGYDFAILQRPSLVACNVTAGAKVPSRSENLEGDSEASEAMEENLEKFFTAYGRDDRESLKENTRGDAILRGADSRLEYSGLEVNAYKTKDSRRRIAYARVDWEMPGGGIVQSDYRLSMYLNDQDRWIVEGISTDVPDSEFAPSEGGVPDSTFDPSKSGESADSSTQSGGGS